MLVSMLIGFLQRMELIIIDKWTNKLFLLDFVHYVLIYSYKVIVYVLAISIVR